MIIHVLYIYAQGIAVTIGGHPDPEFCWGIVHQLEAVGVVADCRQTLLESDLAPETSPFPLNKPERKI